MHLKRRSKNVRAVEVHDCISTAVLPLMSLVDLPLVSGKKTPSNVATAAVEGDEIHYPLDNKSLFFSRSLSGVSGKEDHPLFPLPFPGRLSSKLSLSLFLSLNSRKLWNDSDF